MRDSTGSEPSVLGAAATLPEERRKRRTWGERRRDRRRRRRSAEPKRPAVPPGDASAAVSEGYSETEYVFVPHGSASTPLRPYLRTLWGRRRLMVELARAELRGQRSSTALGALWAVLDPLIQGGIYFLLFTIIRRGGRPIDFLHILIGGMFLFQLALSALTEGGRSIKSSKNLMLNSTFPRALFPMTTVCKGLMTFPSKILIYAVFHLALQAPVGWSLLLLPVLFSFQVLLMVGLALFASTLVVFFSDASNAVQYVGRLLFFTTPVIYPLAVIPDGIRAVLAWQPFFALFASYQEILDGQVPELGLMLQAVLWSVTILVVGTRVFLRHEREFALRL